MALYGSAVYGAVLYGNASNTSNVTLTAVPNGYGGVSVSWNTPGGTWSRIRLVRNTYGYPVQADDGVILVDSATSPGSYTDSGLPAPKFVYYSLFVQQTIGSSLQWTLCGQARGQVVDDHGYGSTLASRLPGVFSSPSGEIGGTGTSSTLQNFLNLLATDINRARDFLDHLLLVEDPDNVTDALLPSLGSMYGFPSEPEIGLRQNRALLRNAVYLWQVNGTSKGVTGFAKSLTGYGASINALANLMLDINVSSFEQSTSTWAVLAGTATLARAVGYSPTYAATYGPAPYANPANDNQQVGTLAVTAGAVGALTLGHVGSSPRTYGVPVTAGQTYTVSAAFQSASTAVSVAVNVAWYDETGTLLSVSNGTAANTTTTGWTRVSTTATAPTKACYLGVEIAYADLANSDVQFVDAVQVQAGNLTDFEDARQIDIVLYGTRVNEIYNAGFTTDVTQWSVSNGTTAQDTATTNDGGAASMKVAVTSTTAASSVSTNIGVEAGASFTFSAYVNPEATADFTLSVSWQPSDGSTIRTDTGTALSVAAGIWGRPTLQAYAPSNATGATLTVTCAAGPTTWNVDDTLAEYGLGAVGAYFEPRTNPGDVVFEGTDYETPSHLYPDSVNKKSRLAAMLPDHLPLGCPFALIFAAPRTGAYSATYSATY